MAEDPTVLLLYKLLQRGSVLKSTLSFLIDEVNDGKVVPENEDLLKQAKISAANLWGA